MRHLALKQIGSMQVNAGYNQLWERGPTYY